MIKMVQVLNSGYDVVNPFDYGITIDDFLLLCDLRGEKDVNDEWSFI